jgi:uracil-DNA glycosylase family 4
VAEAPGRLGADRTGIPLCGDKTGDNFEKLLSNIGWKRSQVFITNAVLCNPREGNGTNGTPTHAEIANCSAYLEMTINLVRPDVIVSLGATALGALDMISPHGLQLREAIAKLAPWYRSKLFPLYHPGPRAMVHRSLAKQRSDFMRLAKAVHPEGGLRTAKKVNPKRKSLLPAGAMPLQQVVRAFLELSGRMTYFKLTKLLYLFDLQAMRVLGRTYASDVYLRQVDGPWPPHLDKALKAMEGYEVRRWFSRGVPIVNIGPSPRAEIQLNDDALRIISEVWEKFGGFSNSAIKTVVYRTTPMRFILAQEDEGKDMRNKAVLYKEKMAAELAEEPD